MYEFITGEIKKKLSTDEKKYVSVWLCDSNYFLLLYLKFKCNQTGIVDFNNQEKLKEIIPTDKLSLYTNFFEYKLNELIIHFENYDIQELLNEYIPKINYNQFEILDNLFINKEDKTVFLNKELIYAKRVIVGRPYAVTKITTIIYNMIDEMKGIERLLYTRLDNVDLDKFNTIIIIDNEPSYRYLTSDTNVIDVVNELFLPSNGFNGKIVLKTSYSNISIIKNRLTLRKYLSKVVLYENSNINDAILIFNNINKPAKISIIMINEEIENDYKKIKKIIESDIPNKNNLLKVEPETIISNNSRIGFKMYLPNKTEEVKSINDLIDENTEITEKITRLNKKIQQEMDKLISK